jgi:hypothetical protein
MKKLFIAALLSMVCISAIPQMAVTTMKLTENEHNFGTFKEEAGRQTYDFYITNTGSQPLVIQNVVASCGCTTPEWTRQPIPAGGRGRSPQSMIQRTGRELSTNLSVFIPTPSQRLPS